jgi:hypothetical protein
MPGVRPQLNTMVVKNKVIRAARWYKISVLAATTLFFGVACALLYTQGLSRTAAISLLFPVAGVLAVYEVFSSRVVLGDNSIDVVSLLKRRSFERSQVAAVKSEGGRVFVEVKGGGRVTLPELGRRSLSMSNSIRAWLGNG